MAYFLGFDAGGTKTECALAQDGVILAQATGATIKVMRVSDEQAHSHLDGLLQAIVAQSGIDLRSIACTCVGLAGNSVPRVAEFVRQSLHDRIGGVVLLAGDQEIALDAAFLGGPGVLVIAGTGSNLIARSSAGDLIHIGGWGPAVADEGSGNWIGKQAVRSVFEALDYGEETLLQARLLEAWELSGDMGTLIDRANQSPAPDFSKLTPVVVQCANEGDTYAARILQRAGEDLGRFAGLAMRRLLTVEERKGAARESSELPEVAFTGSILQYVTQVREAMVETIRREFPSARVRSEAVHAVEGALWRAKEAFHRTQNSSNSRATE